jgi:arylsulfatase A-like enzyme
MTGARNVWRALGHPGLALVSLLLISACRPAPPPRLFVLISVDTLRADYLGAYGSERGLTPRLDALARESAVFTAAYSATAFTLPSVSAILTGHYPEELGIWNNESAVPASVPTLASTLRARGWRTGAVVSNFVLRASAGLDAGFDVYDAEFPQREEVRHWPERIAADTTDAFFRTLDACTLGEAPCFVWVHYQDPHGPYTPPSGTRERYLEAERGAPDGRRLLPVQAEGDGGLGAIPRYQYLRGEREVAFYRAGYAAEVAYLDREVGRLLDGLAARGLDDAALLVFTADHGEGLGERDYWFAHGEHLIDPLVRVPLLIRAPGRSPARRDDLVAAVDLFPTVLGALGVNDADRPPLGRDLLAAGAEAESSTPYLATLGAGSVRRFGIVDGDYKFIASLNDGVWDALLFRRGREEVNLAAPAPQVAASLRAHLREFRRQLPVRPEIRQQFSPEDLAQLRALGYVEVPPPDAAPAPPDLPDD